MQTNNDKDNILDILENCYEDYSPIGGIKSVTSDVNKNYSEDDLNKLYLNINKFVENKARAVFHINDLKDFLNKSGTHTNNVDLIDNAIFHHPKVRIVALHPTNLGFHTTKSQIESELRLIRLIQDDDNQKDYSVKKEVVNKYIEEKVGITPEQENAARRSVLPNKFISVVEGFAGAGKSYTMSVVTKSYKEKKYDTIGITLSWKAANVLKSETNMNCMSMASFLTARNNRSGNDSISHDSLIVVDEAGLIGLSQMTEFLTICKSSRHHVKVILSGDSTQLNPIGDCNSLEIIKNIIPKEAHAVISEIRRQNSISHRSAVLFLKDGKSGEALYIYQQQEMLKFMNSQSDLIGEVLKDYFTALKHKPNDSMLVIAMDNKLVRELSVRIREILIKIGKVDMSTAITLQIPNDSAKSSNNEPKYITQDFAVGDVIHFKKNDKNIKLKDKITNREYDAETFLTNKTNGRISGISGSKENGYEIMVDIEVPGKGPNGTEALAYVKINTKLYTDNSNKILVPIDLNYAITAYSSQGQTVKKVFLVDGELMKRREAYVACSRHRDAMTIYFDKDALAKSIHKDNPNIKFEEIKKEYNNIQFLNHASRKWARPSYQNSVTVHLLNLRNDIRKAFELNTNENVNLKDYNNDINTITKYQRDESYRNSFLSFLQSPKNINIDDILDSEDFYAEIFPQVDINAIREMPQMGYNEDLSIIRELPFEKRNAYPLSELLTSKLFDALQNKYFDIGRGGELRMIMLSNNHVLSKYDINGKDVLGVGFPFIFVSKSTSKDIIIVQDFNNLLELMDSFYFDKNKAANRPLLLWGTKDTDYKYIIHKLNNYHITFDGDDNFKKEHFDKIIFPLNDKKFTATFENIDAKLVHEVVEKHKSENPNLKLPLCLDTINLKGKSLFDLLSIKSYYNLYPTVIENDNNVGYKPKGKFDTSDAQDAVIISEIKNSPICDEYGKLDNDFVKEKTSSKFKTNKNIKPKSDNDEDEKMGFFSRLKKNFTK